MKKDKYTDDAEHQLNKWIQKNVFEHPAVDGPLRVAFYIRGYSHEQDELKRVQEHSKIWSEQYERCLALSKQLGAGSAINHPDDDAEYIDHTPARLDQQEALRELLLRLISKRDIDIVITVSWSRLSRNPVDSFYIRHVIERSGAKLLIAGDVIAPRPEMAAA